MPLSVEYTLGFKDLVLKKNTKYFVNDLYIDYMLK